VHTLVSYLKEKAVGSPLSDSLNECVEPSNSHIGIILTERLLNMPSQIIPPMYKMLVEEMDLAIEAV
jgi:protein BCP1